MAVYRFVVNPAAQLRFEAALASRGFPAGTLQSWISDAEYQLGNNKDRQLERIQNSRQGDIFFQIRLPVTQSQKKYMVYFEVDRVTDGAFERLHLLDVRPVLIDPPLTAKLPTHPTATNPQSGTGGTSSTA